MQSRHSSLTSRCFSRDGNCDCCCCCCCCRGPSRSRGRGQQGNSPDGQPRRNEPRKQRSLLTRYIFVRLPAVFTGGLNWDKGSSVWINLCHIFVWIILVVLPYTLCVILQKMSQAKDIVLNMATAAVASAKGTRNATLLTAMAMGVEETLFNYALAGGGSSSFYSGPHSASSHSVLSSSSSSSVQASSEIGDPRTSTRQTIAVIYGCLIAVMFIAIKAVLYFVHWKLDLIALDALAENNANNRNKKKKKGAVGSALPVRVPPQPQPLASQPSSSSRPITVNHHVLRSISPRSESSVVNESSASSYAGGDSHSVSHNSFEDDDSSSAFTPVLAPTKPAPASSSSLSSSSTAAATHVPVPTASGTKSATSTSKATQQQPQQQPMPFFQLSVPDKGSSSSSGGNDGHISARSSKISLASFDSIGDGVAATGKGRGRKRGKRGDGRRRQSRSEINEDLSAAATDLGDEEPFIPKPDSRRGTKKTPPLPPSIFSGSENGKGGEGGEGLSDGSYSSVSGSSNASTSTAYSETGSYDSDLKKAAGNDADDDSNYEDGRDERDVRTFVDENGEVMYYSFSSPAVVPTAAAVVAPACGGNSSSSSSSKIQEALLSPIGPAPMPAPSSPVKVKGSQASAGQQQHKQNTHKKHHHRGRKRDGSGEAEDSSASTFSSAATTTTATTTAPATGPGTTKAEQERNDEEIARALWEQQLNPRVRVPLIKRYVSRETLVKLFDRDENVFVVIVTVILAAGLAFCSYLTEENFTGFSRFWFWVVVAGAQYCLLKAPQPDSFTPSVEGGLTVTYTRSAYLILATALILLTRELAAGHGGGVQEFVLYGLRFDLRAIAGGLNDVTVYCILISPVFYVFSMLPQIDTLLYYVFEQVNILVFGASGSPSFAAALFEFVRSLFSVSVVAVLCVAAVDVPVLRSLAAAVAVALSFLNSRVINSPKALIPMFRQFTFEGHRFSFWIETEDGRRIRAQDNPQLDYNALCSAYPPMRLVQDCVKTVAILVVTFCVTMTGVLRYLSKEFPWLMNGFALFLGVVFDALIPRLRHAFPFNRFQRPILEAEVYPETGAAKTMWFERLLIYARMAEAYVAYPALLIGYFENCLESGGGEGGVWQGVVVAMALMRALRSTFTDVTRNHLFLLFTVGYFTFDSKVTSEGFMLDYFFGSILMLKIDELVVKFEYYIVYMAPWNLSWGTTYHAVIQPLALPHTTFFILQNVASTLISSPLYPVLGSVVFLTSYPRPVKYWERTRAVDWSDTSNTPLHASLAVTHTATNPDALFYYHLQMALQRTLNRDREAGRMGSVHVGDMFLLTNDTLTALIHIVAIGNGYTTFQLRGLELQGTICQEQELECIKRFDYSLDPNCCCPPRGGTGCGCLPLPPLLSFKDSRDNSWRAWRVVNTAFYLRAYSISIMPATPLFNMFTYRQVLVRMYVCALAYYFVESDSLEKWLANPSFAAAAARVADPAYVEKDPLFYRKIDTDYDSSRKGLTFSAFKADYGEWILHCIAHRRVPLEPLSSTTTSAPPSAMSSSSPSSSSGGEKGEETRVLQMVFSLSISARRMLVLNRACALNTGMFLQRYYSLLGGDFRVTSAQDEWLLADLSVVDQVVGRAARVSLRLHQAYFAKEDIDTPADLRAALRDYERSLVVCREDSPEWRASITSDPPVPQLLSLRKQHDPQAGDVFSVVFLTMQHQPFTLTRLNRECVRGFWAGQQQELVYLGNDNCERGSIQKLNTVLRNLINQACDPPVGYPAFVSELTTSYSRFWPYTTECLEKRMRGKSCAGRAFRFSDSYRQFKNEEMEDVIDVNDDDDDDDEGNNNSGIVSSNDEFTDETDSDDSGGGGGVAMIRIK